MNSNEYTREQRAIVDHLISKHLNGGASDSTTPVLVGRRPQAGPFTPNEQSVLGRGEEQLGRQMLQELDEGERLMMLTKQIQEQALEDRQVSSAIMNRFGIT